MNDEMGVVSKMRKIILIIFSFCLIHSSQSLAGVGDVYYCISSRTTDVHAEKLKGYKPEKFTFKRTGEKLIFGSTGLFKDLTLDKELDAGREYFVYQSSNQTFLHRPSGFTHTSHDPKSVSVVVIIGSCSVFK
jgi:hypothetical protein